MSRILITSGPTRQYLDPVRYLTNASSGRMGAALAEAAVEAGHQVVGRQRAGRRGISGRRRGDPGRVDRGDARRVLAGLSELRRPDRRGRAVRLSAGGRGPAEDPQDGQAAAAGAGRDARHRGRAGGGRRPINGWSLSPWRPKTAACGPCRNSKRKRCDLIVVNGPAAIHAADTQVEIWASRAKCWAVLGQPERRGQKHLRPDPSAVDRSGVRPLCRCQGVEILVGPHVACLQLACGRTLNCLAGGLARRRSASRTRRASPAG